MLGSPYLTLSAPVSSDLFIIYHSVCRLNQMARRNQLLLELCPFGPH